VIPEQPVAGWLAEAHRMYVGRYGHLLLGNFTVTFQPDKHSPHGGTLLFQVRLALQVFPHRGKK